LSLAKKYGLDKETVRKFLYEEGYSCRPRVGIIRKNGTPINGRFKAIKPEVKKIGENSVPTQVPSANKVTPFDAIKLLYEEMSQAHSNMGKMLADMKRRISEMQDGQILLSRENSELRQHLSILNTDSVRKALHFAESFRS
ncbi:MAG TPA: hypothetical protein VEF04_01680, partial [Blastocatellia bacterium]|nr:hypothetical protein [Blastocatellia bacterium]